MSKREELREGDIEAINRVRDLRGAERRESGMPFPRQDRIIIDKGGRRVVYDVDRRGRATIKGYDD